MFWGLCTLISVVLTIIHQAKKDTYTDKSFFFNRIAENKYTFKFMGKGKGVFLQQNHFFFPFFFTFFHSVQGEHCARVQTYLEHISRPKYKHWQERAFYANAFPERWLSLSDGCGKTE